MISVVCIFNNESVLRKYLLRSLENQTVEFELVTIDNTEGKFKSSAEALNYGGKKAKGEYMMFVHPDVDLSSDTWLKEAANILDSIPNLGIAGVAGKCEGTKGVMTIIKHGDPPELAGELYIDKIIEVQTLDECLVIIPRSVFDVLQFDENTCDTGNPHHTWHLYAVEYCLNARKSGFGVYVIPMFIYHRSTGVSTKNRFQIVLSLGSLPDEYYQTLRKLLKKHKNDYKRIYTTCGDWSTSYPLTLQKIWLLVKAGVKFLFPKGKRVSKNDRP